MVETLHATSLQQFVCPNRCVYYISPTSGDPRLLEEVGDLVKGDLVKASLTGFLYCLLRCISAYPTLKIPN